MAKQCCACKAEKPLDAFHANRTRPDGRADECKACRRLRWQKQPAWRKAIIKRHVLLAGGRSRGEARRDAEIAPKNWRKVRDPTLRDALRETYERVLLAPPPLPWESNP